MSFYHLEFVQVLYLRIKHQPYKYKLQLRNCCRCSVDMTHVDECCNFELQRNLSVVSVGKLTFTKTHELCYFTPCLKFIFLQRLLAILAFVA